MVVNDPRPTWDEYYLHIAKAVASRADCTRRQVGALIVQGDRIVSTGYNGAPAGKPGCLTAGACPRGQQSNSEIQPGSSYDTGPGACIALHAEQNAIIRAGLDARGSTIYITDQPCDGCSRLIEGAGITRIVFPSKWRGELSKWQKK